MKISKQRWDEAQKVEITLHDSGPEIKAHYKRGYEIVFELIGSPPAVSALSNMKILEVGPAFYPAVAYYDIKERHVVEPLYSKFPDHIKEDFTNLGIHIHEEPMEHTTFQENEFDEVWCFNLLQHVIDPSETLKKCLHAGKVFRVFEPIDYPIEPSHPHAFTVDWFKEQLPGHPINVYKGGTIKNFHTANCAHALITKAHRV